MKQKEYQQREDTYNKPEQKDVVLSLTVTGARECIMSLLEQMESVKGFSVLDGSFVVNSSDSSTH